MAFFKTQGAVAQRKKAFIEYVSNHPLEPISSTELGKFLNVSSTTIHRYWEEVPKALGGTIEGTNGLGKIWTPPADLKNSEGYSDPTAEKAIMNVVLKDEPDKKKDELRPGSIYIHTTMNGTYDYIYVVAVFDNHTLSIPIFKEGEKGDPGEYAYPVEIPGSADRYYMDISRISTRVKRYTTDLVAKLSHDVLEDVRSTLIGFFGTKTDKETLLESEIARLHQVKEALENKQADFDNYVLQVKKFYGNELENKKAAIADLTNELESKKAAIDDLKAERDHYMNHCETLKESIRILKKTGSNNASGKKADIELKILKAKIDIYEKELFGGEGGI